MPMSLPDFLPSLAAYEADLAARFGPALRRKALRWKHETMRENAFQFLRATCWRWAEAASSLCPSLMDAPPVGSVGDAHAGNFGLWRDAERRLVWGVNDFDEAACLPYPLDLVRLCASILLADDAATAPDLAEIVLPAYADALASPRPFVLEEKHSWLRDLFEADHDRRRAFWRALRRAEPETVDPPAFEAPLRAALPHDATDLIVTPRRAGVGSLGRPRFVVLGTYRGGPIAAEIKGAMPSCWPRGRGTGRPARLANGPNRSPDPSLSYCNDYVLRRLAPNNRKLDFDEIETKLRGKLIAAMAAELAAVHAGDGDGETIRRDLARRPAGWLAKAVHRTAAWTVEEHRAFRSRRVDWPAAVSR